MDNVHERVWEAAESRRPQPAPVWRPLATYTFLGIMGVTFVLQLLAVSRGGSDLHNAIFTVGVDWWQRPWSPITSMFAHADFIHILFNGLVFFFFGPILERILGRRDFIVLVLITGAATGILQVETSAILYGQSANGLGASGAINFIMGTLTILMPREKILIWGIVPVPFWIATLGFAALDALGAFNPASNTGHVAHLVGLAMGLAFGVGLRHNPKLVWRRRAY